ncbi:AraC-like DNA-binding protein [Pedobacter cryoconitis]|uniref:AraC-like DNA-binding protein n=1 Tax=Pedobacter cryoconitis TaxID=188932 RepID=A0A7W8ZK87_9SPHI|nr:helix-turn-helix domain-containing protein [Pedobacter cryoconitis]MBB5635577.1 AraC-like DNA-binding protein [Pedobacter cryoconitis]MBB6273548.1 AraC-like DNA-binding protein [Pedobacter cryoconitis]
MSLPEEAGITDQYLQNINTERTQFRVADTCTANCSLASYNRRDFYKITLTLEGNSILYYPNRAIEINGPALVFTTPMIPYSWEGNPETKVGHFCVFTKEFLQENGRTHNLEESNLFKPGGDPVYFLNDLQADYINSIFNRMKLEQESEYIYKHDLIRNYLNLIIHEAIKMQPAIAYFSPQKASSRIAKLFLDLLEKQFPVDSQQYTLILKKASDYADLLAIHVNHLNAAVSEVTGRSTTHHINNRILAEARSLLMHTDWNVAEIARSLGFDYASYFNNFFKKHTGQTPMTLRKTL